MTPELPAVAMVSVITWILGLALMIMYSDPKFTKPSPVVAFLGFLMMLPGFGLLIKAIISL